jgi:ParB family chromosome partitioning protein
MKMKNTMKKPVNIPVSKLRPFEGHPFKVKDDEEMNTLIESVQTQGILSPLIVRPIENTDEYEIISGHRRVMASRKAGITEVPALVVSLDRDAAAIVLVDSNLHREHILPSEKAFAYKMKADAMNHKGWRTDLTSGQVVPKSDDNRTTAQIGADTGDSYKTVQRYIRLTNLIPEILQYVDDGRIAFTPAVELSYLNEQEQYDLLEQMELNDCAPSLSQACRFKKMSGEQGLTPEVIAAVMSEEKANQREMFKVPMERIRQYVPNANAKQAEDFVLKACEHYRKFLIRQRNRDER